MARWAFLLMLAGCSTAPGDSRRPLAEWHTSSRVYRLDPTREEVKVFEDGFVEARFVPSGEVTGAPRERRVFLTPSQRESLVRLLRDLAQVKNDWEDTGRVCVLSDPATSVHETEAVIRYAPAPGIEWEVKRSHSDGDWPFWRMRPALRSRAEAADAFFRELLWRD